MDTAHLSRASSEPQLELIASPWHTLMVLVIAASNAFRAAIYANHARAGLETSRSHLYLRTIAFECAFLALVTLGVWLRGSSLQTIFGPRWRRVGQVFQDLGSGLALWFVAIVAVSILGGHNEPPDASIAFLLPRLLGGTAIAYSTLTTIAIFAVMCYGVDIVLSYLGEVSLGHTLFWAAGGYAAANLSVKYGLNGWSTAGATIAI